MLRLKTLYVEDFGPFKGAQKISFPPIGVQIVYGENMRGKTSLLNAIRFAFFGKVIGRGTKSTSLHRIGNWEQATNGKYGFKVELEFTSDDQEYKLTRVCSALVDDPVLDDDYQFEHYLERNGSVLGPDQSEAELIRILPEQISRFFLFDGELLQEYEDLLSNESDMGRRISDAIERILGVPILTSSRATALRLKERSEKREATAAQSDQKTQEFGNQLADIHAQRDILNADQKKLTKDLNDLWARRAILEESFVNSRAVMSDRFSAKMQYWFSATMSYVFSPEMSDEIREELQRVMLWWFGFLLSKTPPVQKVGDFGCGSCHRG